MPDPRELYDRPDWFNPFWHSCANHMEENAVIPLLASQKHRIKLVSGKTTSEEAVELTERQQELKRKVKDLERQSTVIKKEEFERRRQKISDELREIEEKRRIQKEKQQTNTMVSTLIKGKYVELKILNISIINF